MSDKEKLKNFVNVDDDDDQESRKCKGCGNKEKGVSFFRRKKGKKVHNQRWKNNNSNNGCFLNSRRKSVSCFKKPQTLDSSCESPSSDPNSSDFTYDMLRGVIEKNEFYSNECNPHLDEME